MTKIRNVALALSALSMLAAACDDEASTGNGPTLNLPGSTGSTLTLPDGAPAATSANGDSGDGTTTTTDDGSPKGAIKGGVTDGGLRDASSYDAGKDAFVAVPGDQHAQLTVGARGAADELLLALFTITA